MSAPRSLGTLGANTTGFRLDHHSIVLTDYRRSGKRVKVTLELTPSSAAYLAMRLWEYQRQLAKQAGDLGDALSNKT